jgi:hypothetical protein
MFVVAQLIMYQQPSVVTVKMGELSSDRAAAYLILQVLGSGASVICTFIKPKNLPQLPPTQLKPSSASTALAMPSVCGQGNPQRKVMASPSTSIVGSVSDLPHPL